MNDTPTLDAPPASAAPARPAHRPDAPPPAPGKARRAVSVAFGWGWRLLVGALCCTSYFGAVLLTGWLYRLVQGRVLYGWWKQSPLRDEQSFADFRATLGPDAPVTRPRWLLREDFNRGAVRAEVEHPTADGERPLPLHRLLRLLAAPVRSFLLNLKVGFLGVLATFLLTGWGCALMTFSWEFGWLNSFHKGYELAPAGPLLGVGGILLFAAAMLYVPMAQAHQAVTGDFRAFFEFRFVWRLVRARLSAYVVLAAVWAAFAFVLQILKTAPAFLDDHLDSLSDASDGELLQFLRTYYFWCGCFLLLTLLATRLLAARVYRSAVLKVLRRGRWQPEVLHPRLRDWLGRLGLVPAPRPPAAGALRVVRIGARRTYRRALFPLLFVFWLLFTFQVYVGEFLNYHPVVGFLNHPTVQLPCFNYVPDHLEKAAQP